MKYEDILNKYNKYILMINNDGNANIPVFNMNDANKLLEDKFSKMRYVFNDLEKSLNQTVSKTPYFSLIDKVVFDYDFDKYILIIKFRNGKDVKLYRDFDETNLTAFYFEPFLDLTDIEMDSIKMFFRSYNQIISKFVLREYEDVLNSLVELCKSEEFSWTLVFDGENKELGMSSKTYLSTRGEIKNSFTNNSNFERNYVSYGYVSHQPSFDINELNKLIPANTNIFFQSFLFNDEDNNKNKQY